MRALALALALLAPPEPPEKGPDPILRPAPVVEGAVEWDRLLGDLLRRERQGPLAAARLVGITGVAVHEAAAPGLGLHPLEAQLRGFGAVARPNEPIDPAVAVDAAAARLLRGLFEQRGRDALGAIEEAARRRPAPDGPSRRHGEAVADAVLGWAREDGSTRLDACAKERKPSRKPGAWVPTMPQLRARPLGPCWGTLRPIVERSCDAPLAPPPPYSEEPGSAFHAMAVEVRDAVRRQDPVEREIALFWSDDPGATGTPAGHWLAILDQLAVERAVEPATYVRARAALGAALHDASIACWRGKFEHDLMRPVTYIQRHLDPSWVPLLQTPPFPEYPSGHAVLSGAAAVVLAAHLGDGPFEDRTRAERGHAPRRYESFGAAAQEAAVSRLYGGIHFRPACDEGVVQGRLVGERVQRGLAPRRD